MKTKLKMLVGTARRAVRSLALFAAVAAATAAWADTETVGDYTWTYQIYDDTAEIYGTYGGPYSSIPAISPSPTGAVTIPSTLGGKPVTSIGWAAFSGCSGLTSVTIPDSVTSIGNYAFYNCSGLLSFSVAADNPSYKSVSGLLLTKDGKTLVAGINGDVTIPDSVTSIGYRAFYGCSGLTSVTIPDSVTNIEWGAFEDCSGLTSVTIPDSVTSIGDEAFYGCSGLTSVTIPGSVTSIGDKAFSDCSGLTSVTIPDSVTSIGTYAFYGCSGLTSVTIPNSVTDIWFGTFDGCNNVRVATVPGWQCGIPFDSVTNLVISDGVTSIEPSAFYGCSGLTSVTIPDNVTNIGNSAFCNCSGLTSVTIPNSVTSIGSSAFYGCSGLTSVMIPDSVTSIGWYAFKGCSGLTSVTIGNGVTSIGKEAFYGCSGLTSVMIPDGVTSIEEDAFSNCNSSLYDTNSISGVRLVDGWAVGHTESLSGNLNLTGVRGIGDWAFEGCSGLTSVTIGNGVTSIGSGAFDGCSGLTSVTIPNSVTSIGDCAFYACSGLTSVMIPDSVTSIEWGAFSGCSGLTSVTIPDSVTSIEPEAFAYCSGLTSVYVEVGDTDRVKSLLSGSGLDVSGITFIEDVVPGPVTPDPVTPDPVTPDPVTPDPVNPDPSTPDPVTPAPVTPGYEVMEATDIVAPYVAPKAVTLHGVAYDGGDVLGVVELKLGKVNAKKGTGKVSGSLMTLDGKAHKIAAFNLAEIDGTTPKAVTLEVKDFGTMSVTIGGTQFAGSMGKYHVQSGTVGGNWTRGGAMVYVDVDGADGGGTPSLPAGALVDLLPNGEPVVAANGKWKFAKAAGVKWAKPKKGAEPPEIYDEASGKGLIVDETKGKTNLSGMKLTYTPKKGTFKGSFKLYALTGAGKATKLKKYTVKVSGVVVGGVGHGTATCKNPAVNWAVTVE